MIHYIYKLVHPTGRYYIGRHSTKNFDDGYMGSGKWPRSIKNKQELSKEIMLYCTSVDELLNAEKALLTEHVGKPLCMNFNNNASGFASGRLNPAATEKEKIRKSKLTGERHPMFGKKHSDQAKSKMSKSQKGKPTWNKGLSGIKTSNKGQVAWNKGLQTGHKSFAGKTHTEESIALMRKGHANRARLACPHCNKILDKPNFTRYHGDRCKFKELDLPSRLF